MRTGRVKSGALTDILWGNRAGARTCLVSTGISAGESLPPEMTPAQVFSDLPALLRHDFGGSP